MRQSFGLAVASVLLSTMACNRSTSAEADAGAASTAPSASASAAIATADAAVVVDAGKADTKGEDFVIAAKHAGFTAAWPVGKRLVLVGCQKLRVLDQDLGSGKDTAAPIIGPKPKYLTSCESFVHGVAGNALIVGGTDPGSKLQSIDIDSGAVTPFTGKVPADPRANPRFAYAPYGLVRELDPKTKHVKWEYGTGANIADSLQTPVLWMYKGEEILAVQTGTVSTKFGQADTIDTITLFHRGADAPAWSGTISGTITEQGDPKAEDAKGMQVFVAGATTKADAKGHYSVKVTTRGPIHIETGACGASCGTLGKVIEPNPATHSYDVDLVIGSFDQACK